MCVVGITSKETTNCACIDFDQEVKGKPNQHTTNKINIRYSYTHTDAHELILKSFNFIQIDGQSVRVRKRAKDEIEIVCDY